MQSEREGNEIWYNAMKVQGFNKRWIYRNRHYEHIAHDYLQKMCYIVQDFYHAGNKLQYRSNIIYMIVLLSWAFDVVDRFIDSKSGVFRSGILSHFSYDTPEYGRCKTYMKAIRSYAMAHPLNTTRHPKFGLDGTYFAVDIHKGLPAIESFFS